nr:ECF transporter S component [Natranaerobius trueperi]
MNTRKLTIGGILAALCIVMSLTPLGFVPVPTPAGAVTTMHIPVIIAGILEGPIVGGVVGGIFGLTSFIRGGQFFGDPVIAILPRLLIGPGAYYFMQLTKKIFRSQNFSISIGAFIGTIINTVGVLILASIRGYIPVEGAYIILLTHGIPEIIIAIVVTVIIGRVIVNHIGGTSKKKIHS